MSKSFIINPEVSLAISSKSLPRKKKSSDEASGQPSQVKFSARELELLGKVNEINLEKTSTKENENKSGKLTKKDKLTTLTLSELKELKEELEFPVFLCDVIEGAVVKLPENEIVERNPVLEKRIQRLKAEQEQRVYNSMTKNVDSSRKYQPEETISFQRKSRCIL